MKKLITAILVTMMMVAANAQINVCDNWKRVDGCVVKYEWVEGYEKAYNEASAEFLKAMKDHRAEKKEINQKIKELYAEINSLHEQSNIEGIIANEAKTNELMNQINELNKRLNDFDTEEKTLSLKANQLYKEGRVEKRIPEAEYAAQIKKELNTDTVYINGKLW